MNNDRDQAFASHYDVIIAGARAAGASTALLLARRGLRVLAVDRAPAGSDTLSTHALMRGAVLQLRRWGLLDRIVAAGTPAIRATTFHYGDEAIEVPIKPRDGVDALYAPRRTVLDPLLAAAATEAGAHVVHGASVVDLLRGPGGRVRGALVSGPDGATVPVTARLVIGADGLHSKVARLVGAPALRTARHATSVVYGYWSGLELKGNHWYYRPGVSIGWIPTNDGLTCVFVALPPERFRALLPQGLGALYREALAAGDPELAHMLERARPAGKLRAFAGEPGFMRRAHGPGWALVGDAGYFRDPLTAHGITDALRDAELLARAYADGGEAALPSYQAARDALATGFFEVTDAVASFGWDLERVKALHLEMSALMAAEVDALRALNAPLALSAGAGP